MPMPAGFSGDSSSGRTHITSPVPWMSSKPSPRRNSNPSSRPTGSGVCVRMNIPPGERFAEYSLMKPLNHSNLS
jgi:hypothetical protein